MPNLFNLKQANLNLRWILVFFPGILFWLAWPPNLIFPLVFIAFVPLLICFHHHYFSSNSNSILRFSFVIYLSMLIWNLLTTWWIWNAAKWGSIPAFTLNALLMTIPWLLAFITAKKSSFKQGYFSLPIFWLAFEHIHLQWELTWPWLTLGNSLAAFPMLFQWYEFTGHLGGSLWIWAVNLALFYAIFLNETSNNFFQKFKISFLLIFLPILISITLYYTYEENGKPVNVTVVQPNIDPYNEKFSFAYFEDQWNKFISLSLLLSTPVTRFVVWPETAIPGHIWKHKLEDSKALKRIDTLLHQLPQAQLIAGAAFYELYEHKKSATSRYFQDGACCYDAYNTALQLDTSGCINLYHKSKLVPGVERMPYPQIFGFLEKFSMDLGGTSGSLATQDERTIFETKDGLKLGVAICYESVFGDFMTGYSRAGAQAIFIITNDAWWYDTPGYQQHLVYASLRAVELRKSIARSANTGISCFINQRGNIQQATKYETATAINQAILFNSSITFYAKYGDIIGRIALFISLYLLLLPWIKKIREKRKLLQ